MEYHLYCSCGNSLGLDEYLGYFEIADDGFCRRYLEIKSDGQALRYTEQHAADGKGQLPEGNWHEGEQERAKPEYGPCFAISRELFETAWSRTRCDNEIEPCATRGAT